MKAIMKMIPIIIPYYQAEKELKKCLAALENQAYKPIEIFVRDNSTDNILFTAAINEGLKKFICQNEIEYIFVLNQDAYVQEETINKLVKCMEDTPDCGIACPIQISENNAVYWGGSYDAFPFGKHRCDPLDSYKNDFETYWANGAAMLLRTEMIREIGLWDKNMKFIASDADYSFTARSRGWKVMVAYEARVYHSGGSASLAANHYINQVKIKDTIYFIKKWLTGDLYKSLSFEGKSLTRMTIQVAVENLEREII